MLMITAVFSSIDVDDVECRNNYVIALVDMSSHETTRLGSSRYFGRCNINREFLENTKSSNMFPRGADQYVAMGKRRGVTQCWPICPTFSQPNPHLPSSLPEYKLGNYTRKVFHTTFMTRRQPELFLNSVRISTSGFFSELQFTGPEISIDPGTLTTHSSSGTLLLP